MAHNPQIKYSGISQTKSTLSGKARISERRISVELILNHLISGSSVQEIANMFNLTDTEVKIAIGYAKECVMHFDQG